ncbi:MULTISPECIES: hypothetical protein [unclassified Beijerinckia]|uniref:hypothetical protein n=1 Tax=unclassified Beijerinckia TaxID=2638183 RepID=UPI00089B7EFD|nr:MULTISPECIES: hypothetical protein [unclassified Beijerinckia]MDH7796435.1 hypothetical protein [Beijerinckia sp. GAS462]SEC44938.1 hypothetical protein SAMN05443249_2717 [Beijerinckia sp. 28-YEA-48]
MAKLFDFPYHKISDRYPESSKIVQYGRGYSFASAPIGPDQMIFKLRFDAMFHWLTLYEQIDRYTKPQLNIVLLQEFYEEVRMFTPFNYKHWRRGLVTVRFNKPLPEMMPMTEKIIVDQVTGSRGHQVEGFDVELILQPL